MDFRLKNYLHDMPEAGDVPLLYPCHFTSSCITWPKKGMKKPNAIQLNSNTEKWLYPNGFYCVVRRMSSKEEKHRIVARVVDPSTFKNTTKIDFENHLNVFHDNKTGLSQVLATGLAVFLNTTVADNCFRCFNGHTQVNAADLKRMRYPSRETLACLGAWALVQEALTQEMIDEKLTELAI